MGQSAWTVTTNRGRQFTIGLYHGEDSGHVVVHCNNRITHIDFNITQDKQYTFFLDEELCKLDIKKTGNQYAYEFELDKAADTPLNKHRKSVERDSLRRMAWGLVSVVFFFGLLLLLSLASNSRRDADQTRMLAELRGSDQFPSTEVRFVPEANGLHWIYSYRVGTEIFTGPLEQKDIPHLPLAKGDAFELRYQPEQPDLFFVDFNKPTDKTLQSYGERVREVHTAAHDELHQIQIDCQVRLAFELEGLDGLSKLYHQDTSKEDNPIYNEAAYLRFIRSSPFRKGAEACL